MSFHICKLVQPLILLNTTNSLFTISSSVTNLAYQLSTTYCQTKSLFPL